MTQKDVSEIFSKTNAHLVDITGLGNFFCREHQLLSDNLSICGITNDDVKSFKYCPFCGRKLENNVSGI